MGKYRKYTQEYRDEAVRLVLDGSRPIAQVARELGINEGTLGNWIAKYRAAHPVSEELTLPDRVRLRELERENRELRLQAEFLKSSRLLRPGAAVSVKYALIGVEKADLTSPYPVALMCAVLGVSRSGFYEWTHAEPSAAARRRATVATHVQAAFDAGRGVYGARRVHAIVARSDDPQVASASLKLIRSVMAERGLRACQPRAYRVTTTPDERAGAPKVSDHLGRDFTATAPGTKLVGDITYLATWSGWLYLATVIDCHTKAVVGWSMADHMRTDLVCDALSMAATNVELAPGAIFHSDRGSQYTSTQFAVHVKGLDLTASMGRTGICWDNALAESFFAALKNELVYRTVFPTKAKARRAVAEYIEVFYNRQRIHSALGYKTPLEAATAYQQNTSLAA